MNTTSNAKAPKLSVGKAIQAKIFGMLVPQAVQKTIWESLLYSETTFNRRGMTIEGKRVRTHLDSVSYLFDSKVKEDNRFKR